MLNFSRYRSQHPTLNYRFYPLNWQYYAYQGVYRSQVCIPQLSVEKQQEWGYPVPDIFSGFRVQYLRENREAITSISDIGLQY